MTSLKLINHQIERFRIPHSSAAWLAVVFLIVAGHPMAPCFAQEAVADEPGAEVLTRGPVHEAFAGTISFNPLPGIVVTAAPPLD